MSLIVRNTQNLVEPDKLRLKMLVYGISGTGKTLFCSTAPNPGIIACETGHGNGQLTNAGKSLEFIEPTSIQDIEAVINGKVFQDKKTLVLDSLSEMVKTFVKEAALKIPRARGESDKRRQGIPELDDFGTMGEMTRKILRAIINNHPDKHIIAVATEKYDKADPEAGQFETLIGPDLPGAMFLGAPAAFDLVLRLRVRSALRDPKDAKSRYTQRYFQTEPDGSGAILKARPNRDCKNFLAREEVFDPENGKGTFQFFLDKVLAGYAESATPTV